MPTRGRPAFAARALGCFMRQTYPNRELVIIDDADAPSFPDGLHASNVRYSLIERRRTVGAKRNLAISRCSPGSSIICHFDDDDYSAPTRIEEQVARLIETNSQITGFHSMMFVDASGRWWKYLGFPNYALGTSLCYTREFWRANPFIDKQVGEDNAMVSRAGNIASVDAGNVMYATMHAGNTSPREGVGSLDCWQLCESLTSGVPTASSRVS